MRIFAGSYTTELRPQAWQKPTTGNAGCSARAASGQAATEPASVMNSRRLTGSNCTGYPIGEDQVRGSLQCEMSSPLMSVQSKGWIATRAQPPTNLRSTPKAAADARSDAGA